MSKTTLILIALLLAVNAQAGRVDTVFVHSAAMNKDIRTVIVSPTQTRKNKDVHYPVVYLLHGAGANSKYYLERVKPTLPQVADEMGMIFVTPDALNSWYIDSPKNPALRYETFTSAELVHYVDSLYPTIPQREGRATLGLSMGGHGALYLAFRHKDVYGACGSMSGGVDFRPFPMNWEIRRSLGEMANNRKLWDANVVVNQIGRISNGDLAIMIDCGEGDFFLEVNKSLHERLLGRGIDHDFITRPGAHNPHYWQNAIDYQLFFLHRYFERSRK